MYFVIFLFIFLSGCNDLSHKNNELATMIFMIFILYLVLNMITQWLFSSKTLVHIKEWVTDVLIPYVVPIISLLFIILFGFHLNGKYYHPIFIVIVCIFLLACSIKQKHLTDQHEKQKNVKIIAISMTALAALIYLFFCFNKLINFFS